MDIIDLQSAGTAGAFVGVCFTVDNEDDDLAWILDSDEERMQDIGTIMGYTDEPLFENYKAVGITEVILIRGW